VEVRKRITLESKGEEKAMKAGTTGRFILAVTGVLLAITAAGAQGPDGGRRGGPGFRGHESPMMGAFGEMGGGKGWWNNPRVVERLKLTDDQRKAMDGILLQHKEKLIDLRADLQKAELAMQPLMSADTPNDAAITAQIDKVVQARAELEKANSRFLLAIRDKLTPDQWKQIQAFRDDGGMRRQEWRRDGQRPGMQGPGGQFRRQGPPGQQQQVPPPPPPSAPNAAPGNGSGTEQ
jgi:Spy/CpxP family protein refolding chaperone